MSKYVARCLIKMTKYAMIKLLKKIYTKVIKTMVKSIKASTMYKIIFVCDKELIPVKNSKTLIERCSVMKSSYRKKSKKDIEDAPLILRSSLKNSKCQK